MDRVAMGREELPPFNHRSGRIGGRLTRVAGPVCCREGPEVDQEQKQDKAAEAVANPSECVGHGLEVDGEGEEEEVKSTSIVSGSCVPCGRRGLVEDRRIVWGVDDAESSIAEEQTPAGSRNRKGTHGAGPCVPERMISQCGGVSSSSQGTPRCPRCPSSCRGGTPSPQSAPCRPESCASPTRVSSWASAAGVLRGGCQKE